MLEHVEAIRNAATPKIAARLGRCPSRPLRRDWDSVKDSVMRKTVQAKFTQHPALRPLLLSTGEALLVEDSPRDSYWGNGADGTGLNARKDPDGSSSRA